MSMEELTLPELPEGWAWKIEKVVHEAPTYYNRLVMDLTVGGRKRHVDEVPTVKIHLMDAAEVSVKHRTLLHSMEFESLSEMLTAGYLGGEDTGFSFHSWPRYKGVKSTATAENICETARDMLAKYEEEQEMLRERARLLTEREAALESFVGVYPPKKWKVQV